MGGALMRRWTSVAPALRSSATICWVVVPRTIEIVDDDQAPAADLLAKGAELHVTPRWRRPADGWMKVRPA